MTKRSRLGLLRDLVLSLTALVGAVCLVLVIAGLAFGVHPLLFRSGSMSPAIDTGDLALARTVDATGLKRGDVVSVITASGQRVTHRVVGNTPQGGGLAQLQLKGDANKAPDSQVYDVRHAEKVFLRIPKMGYVVSWFSHAPGSFVLAGYVALMLLLVFRRPGKKAANIDVTDAATPTLPVSVPAAVARTSVEEPAETPAASVKKPLKAAAIAGGLALGLAALAGWGQNTGAFWTDQVKVTGTSFTAGTSGWPLPPPTLGNPICTSPGGKQVKFNWNAVTGAVKYIVTITPTGGSAQTFTVLSPTTSYTYSSGQSQEPGSFTVRAVDGSNVQGPPSASVSYTTSNASQTQPAICTQP